MALQVWLPLNGNLNNQGLAGDFTLSGNATYGSGKFGQAISTNKTNNYYTVPELNGVSNYTIAYWEKIDSSAEYSQWADLWQVQVKNGGTTSVMRDELRSTSVPGYCKVHMVKDASVGSNTNTYAGLGDDSDRAKDKWAHVAVVKDDDYVYQYINGVFDTKLACSAFEASPQTLTGYIKIGENGTNSCPAWVQDFRIYDNCLSAKEIQILSRGLVLHYPLAMPGGDNLIKSTAEMATNMWGYGAKASRIIEDGVPVVKLEGTSANWTSDIDSPKSVGTQYLIPYSDVRNKTVTFSCWVKANQEIENTITFSLRTAASATRTKYYSPYKIPITTEWKRVSFTTTVTDASFVSGSGTPADTDYFFVQMYNHVDDVIIYTKGWKLEYGDKATTWMPNAVDDEYTAMGFGDGIEYDVSGFGYNGARYGNITCSTNTPRYNTCYEFDTTSYVKLDQALYPIFRMGRDETTISIWAYKDDWTDYTETDGATAQRYTMFSCQEGGGWATYIRGTGVITFQFNAGESSHYIGKNSTLSAGALSAGWHMFTTTYDGFTLRGYIDGVLRTTETAAYTEKTPVFYNTGTACIYIGVESGSGAPANLWWNGKLSDFRVYETALSSADILELYQTGASLASNGTLMTSEFVESV